MRVGAILEIKDGVCDFFGFGVLEGENIPPKNLGVRIDGQLVVKPVPQIRLDHGPLIFGCECWWVEEEEINELIKGYRIRHISVREHRRAQRL